MSAAPKRPQLLALSECHSLYGIDIEQALLGALFIDNRLIDEAAAQLEAHHFYDPLHARMFDIIVYLRSEGTVTPLLVNAVMKTDPGLVEIGGIAYLAGLAGAAPAMPNVRDVARILHDLAVRRGAVRAAEEIIAAAHAPRSEIGTAQLIEKADCEIQALGDLQRENSGTAIPFIDVREWEGTPAPPRQWAVQNRIPLRCTTLLSGEGSVGKTLLAEQLAVATVLEKEWLGVVPRRGAAIMVCCEDDEDEMHRRFERIAEYYQAPFSALADLHPLSLVGQDAAFAVPTGDGRIEPTQLFRRVMKAAKAIRPSILILDNSADIYAGNENDRAQVRQFVTLLTQIAVEADCAVLLTSHPSLSGITSGSGISGSTAWHASVRARLYMRKPKAEGDDEADADERVLEVMKSNYGPPGESIGLRWQNGLFLPTQAVHWIDKRAAADIADGVFLRLLTKFEMQARNVSDKPTAPNYAPTAFAKEPDAKEKRIKNAALAAAMSRLFSQDKIHLETYGRKARPAQKLAIGPGTATRAATV